MPRWRKSSSVADGCRWSRRAWSNRSPIERCFANVLSDKERASKLWLRLLLPPVVCRRAQRRKRNAADRRTSIGCKRGHSLHEVALLHAQLRLARPILFPKPWPTLGSSLPCKGHGICLGRHWRLACLRNHAAPHLDGTEQLPKVCLWGPQSTAWPQRANRKRGHGNLRKPWKRAAKKSQPVRPSWLLIVKLCAQELQSLSVADARFN